MWAALCDTLQHGMEWSAAAGTLHAVALRLHQLPKPAAQHPTSTCMYLRPLLTSAAGTDTPTNTAMTRMRRLKSCMQRSRARFAPGGACRALDSTHTPMPVARFQKKPQQQCQPRLPHLLDDPAARPALNQRHIVCEQRARHQQRALGVDQARLGTQRAGHAAAVHRESKQRNTC